MCIEVLGHALQCVPCTGKAATPRNIQATLLHFGAILLSPHFNLLCALMNGRLLLILRPSFRIFASFFRLSMCRFTVLTGYLPMLLQGCGLHVDSVRTSISALHTPRFRNLMGVYGCGTHLAPPRASGRFFDRLYASLSDEGGLQGAHQIDEGHLDF